MLFTGYSLNFSNNPESIEVMLEFMGRLSVREMQSLVATVLFEATPRYRYNDVVGHLIGDLLVYYADLLIADPPFGKSLICYLLMGGNEKLNTTSKTA